MSTRVPSGRSVSFRNELPSVDKGWLEGQLAKLPGISACLAACDGGFMREAVVLARERLGFARIGIWILENEGSSAVGTFGVDEAGQLVDESGLRVFDRTGFIRGMMVAWADVPHYYENAHCELRSAEAKLVGLGSHVTAPLFFKNEIFGFVAVDNLIESGSVNERTGPLLIQFAQVVSSAYAIKKLEEEVARSRAEVVEAEREKNEFLGMMGHEVRTPLNAILGYAQLLKKSGERRDVGQIANTIEECGSHLSGLVDSILEYSHLAGGDLKRWYKLGDPIDILKSTVNGFGAMYETKRLSLDFRHEGDGELAYFDAVSLRQVLSNLLQNAFKYTEEGGVRVRVLTRCVEGGVSQVFIEVRDSGIGMTEEEQGSIFEPFRQVRSGRDKAKGGIGMGLAIVKRLVGSMGGSIECRSLKGSGTVFSIDLEFKNVDSGEAALSLLAKEGERATERGSRILVVEDNETNLEVLRSMIEFLGYMDIDFAKDGEEARLMLEEHPYDLVFMDVQMPHLDGLSLTRLIRAGRSCPINRGVPIVGVTAFTSKHDREQCLMAGMNDYIEKPVMIESMKRALSLA